MAPHESEIETVERRFWQCLLAKDAAGATALIAESCTTCGPSGIAVLDRDGYAAAMAEADWDLRGFEIGDMHISFPSPKVAVAAYEVRQKIVSDGRETDLTTADSSVWVRGEDGSWRCALHTQSVTEPAGES